MNDQLKKSAQRKFFPRLAVILVFSGIFSVLFASAEPPKQPPAEPPKTVLYSSLAGQWYPADAEELGRQIAAFFQKAQAEPIKDVIAFILPHAGYQFSGQTAAFALKSTDKKYKRIIIIGPSHRVPMADILSVPTVTHYQTPLGQIPLDVEFIQKLLKHPVFRDVPNVHKYEHSVQIELPLLQYSQKDFRLVPIVAGSCSSQTISKAASILKSMVDDDTLVIASSDFVHYGPSYDYVPFTANIPEQLKKLDMGAFEYIAKLDSIGFLEYRQKTGATICGYVPIAILLSMLDKPTEVKLANYATSGELTGDFTNSVSYLSIVFSGKWTAKPLVEPRGTNLELTEEDKNQLLSLARQSIIYALVHKRLPNDSDLDFKISDAMKSPRAAFVTLKKNSQLRGCIGDIFPRQPLYKSVIANAVNAAVNDWRFSPVTSSECNDITIEISVLTAPEPVDSADKIRIGIDGVVLNKNGRSAVFLPQVAPEQGWNVNQMLSNLAVKAGLPEDAWKQGAGFQVFQAVIFGEKEK